MPTTPRFSKKHRPCSLEDLISGVTTPYSRTELRVAGYAFGGAGIGYIDWTHPQGGSYNLGGSFGAFLHRRYGSSLDRELISMCNDNGSPQSSYDCVNQYIVRHGGTSFEDDFARMGATTLGMMTGGQLPLGFGLPGMILDGIPLKPLGNYALESPFSEPPADLGGNFGATTQSFLRDYMDAGQTTFRRDNVVVPANYHAHGRRQRPAGLLIRATEHAPARRRTHHAAPAGAPSRGRLLPRDLPLRGPGRAGRRPRTARGAHDYLFPVAGRHHQPLAPRHLGRSLASV